MAAMFKNLLMACAGCLLLAACVSEPTPFQLGEEALPPHGCIDYRERGGAC